MSLFRPHRRQPSPAPTGLSRGLRAVRAANAITAVARTAVATNSRSRAENSTSVSSGPVRGAESIIVLSDSNSASSPELSQIHTRSVPEVQFPESSAVSQRPRNRVNSRRGQFRPNEIANSVNAEASARSSRAVANASLGALNQPIRTRASSRNVVGEIDPQIPEVRRANSSTRRATTRNAQRRRLRN
jgi:hypothetical protein